MILDFTHKKTCNPRRKSLVLAVFCFGVALAQRCKLRSVAQQLHPLGTPNMMERRLQRFLSRGKLPLQIVQQQLARWVISRCVCGRAVLLVDETSLGDHLRVMAVCLAYAGRAIRVAWECYVPEEYPEGGQVALVLELLDRIAPALEGVAEVVVEADRGIGCSPRLLEGIAWRCWYYLIRRLLEGGRAGSVAVGNEPPADRSDNLRDADVGGVSLS